MVVDLLWAKVNYCLNGLLSAASWMFSYHLPDHDYLAAMSVTSYCTHFVNGS